MKRKVGEYEWIDLEEEINSKVLEHFESDYTSSGSKFFQEALDSINCCVFDHINKNLCKLFTDEEIKAATFGLGGLKALGLDGFSGMFFHNYCEVVGG